MMAVFFFIVYEKHFKSNAQPQTGAYSCLFWKAWEMSRFRVGFKN